MRYGALLPILSFLPTAGNTRGGMAPDAPASRYLPTKDTLRAKLQGLPSTNRATFVHAWLTEVKSHWERVRQNSTLLAGLENAAENDAVMDSRNPPVQQPLNGFPPPFGDFPHRLRTEATGMTISGSGAAIKVRDLVEQVDSPSHSLFTRATSSVERAVDTVVALRLLDDLAIRLIVTDEVARFSQVPIATVLALYRQEGNLCVFPSFDSIKDGIPSGAVIGQTAKGGERTYAMVPFLADISTLVWLADAFDALFDNLSTNEKGLTVKFTALAYVYFSQVLGGDRISGRASGYERSPSGFAVEKFAPWSAENWRLVGLAANGEAEAASRWNDLLNNLDFEFTDGFDGNAPAAVYAAPTDPIKFLKDLLLEGVVFLKSLGVASALVLKKGSQQAWTSIPTLPLGMAAARYNLQAGIDVGQDCEFLFSAVRRVMDPKFVPRNDMDHELRAQIQGSQDLLQLIGDVATRRVTAVTANDHPDYRMKPQFAEWLKTGNNLALLCLFVQTAGKKEWKSWAIPKKTPRGYLSSFLRLDYYYRLLFGSYPV